MSKISEVIVHTLKSAGVDVVFGIPSVHNIGLYDALRQEPAIRHILCRHESTATHMADGYARSSQKVGVVLVSTGPGVSYTLSPLVEAWWSCSPVLVITSNVRTDQKGKGLGALHEVHNQADLFKDITKARICLDKEQDIQAEVQKALTIALSGRPGPVYLEVPTDLWDLEAIDHGKTASEALPKTPPIPDLGEAVQLLESAECPMIISGIEALHAGLAPAVRQLAETLHSPVITDVDGKGIVPDDHPLAFGSATRRGNIQEFYGKCDVTLAIGSRLRYVDFKRRGVAFPKLIHMDWDGKWMNKNYPAEVQLQGDVREMVASLTEKLAGSPSATSRREYVRGLRDRIDRFYAEAIEDCIEAAYVSVLRRTIPRDGRLIVDNTIIGYFTEQLYSTLTPGGMMAPKGASPIGFSFSAAIGAKLAHPSTPVVGLIGDGGFLYSTHDLTTCAQHGIGFPIIVVNDSAFRMIDWLQQFNYQKGYETGLKNPDFVALARSYGIEGVGVDSPEKLGVALDKALTSGAMVLIELIASFPTPPFGQV